MASMFSTSEADKGQSGQDDFVIIGVAVGTLLVLAALGNYYFITLRDMLLRLSSNNSALVVSLLLLNVALAIYGWRKWHDAKREVIERTAAEQRAQSLASTDPLTGFLNRRVFADAVDELLAATKKNRSVAMLIVDLDGFKTINDVHGHLTGDNLLRTTAEVIAKTLPKG